MITARDFAKPMSNGFEFGLDKVRSVAALRLLADQIEAGTAIVSKASVSSKAMPDDFTTFMVMIELVEKNSA